MRNSAGRIEADSSELEDAGRYALCFEGQYAHATIEAKRSQPFAPCASLRVS